MSQRLGGKDCRAWETRREPCTGRDLDSNGKQIPCEHNGFIGIPLAQVIPEGYGRSALKEGCTRRDISPGVDKSRWKAPKLHPEGRPFKPSNATAGVPIGSLLSWTEDGAKRSGQVWAACWKKPGAVWVAPDDGGSAVALCTKTLDVLR